MSTNMPVEQGVTGARAVQMVEASLGAGCFDLGDLPTLIEDHNTRLEVPSGDDGYIAHCANILILTAWLIENYGDDDQLENAVLGMRPDQDHQLQVLRLNEQIEVFKGQILTPEAASTREQIGNRYRNVDIVTQGQSREFRAASRLATMQGMRVLTDFDGTITREEEIQKVNGVKPGHPGAYIADTVIGRTREVMSFDEAFLAVYPYIFLPALQRYPEDFRNHGRVIPIREGVEEFFGYMTELSKTGRVDLGFVSTNFTLTIDGFLERVEHPDSVKIWAIDDSSVVATEKGAVLTHEAIGDPGKGVVFIGDGVSDQKAIQAQDVVAFYFALEGSTFERQLQENGLLYFPYRDFTDINRTFSQISDLMPQAHASLATKHNTPQAKVLSPVVN